MQIIVPISRVMPPRKKRTHGNKQKKGHLINVLANAVRNMETLQKEKDRQYQRAVARQVYLTSAGVRLCHEDEGPGPELVSLFKELTLFCELLTPDEFSKSLEMARSFADKVNPWAGITDATQSLEAPATGSLEVRTSPSPESTPAPKASKDPAESAPVPKASKKEQKLSGDALMEEVDGDAASTVAPSGCQLRPGREHYGRCPVHC